MDPTITLWCSVITESGKCSKCIPFSSTMVDCANLSYSIKSESKYEQQERDISFRHYFTERRQTMHMFIPNRPSTIDLQNEINEKAQEFFTIIDCLKNTLLCFSVDLAHLIGQYLLSERTFAFLHTYVIKRNEEEMCLSKSKNFPLFMTLGLVKEKVEKAAVFPHCFMCGCLATLFCDCLNHLQYKVYYCSEECKKWHHYCIAGLD